MPTSNSELERVLVLSGGVGGAKLVAGLDQVVPREALTVITNTGDDFRHLGMHISPDLDTVMYTLAGRANPETGWGLRDESWGFMSALEELDPDSWFKLGDRDLTTHVQRTRMLNDGTTLSEVTAQLCYQLGIETTILPMTDDAVRTMVDTTGGEIAFQDYFVRQKAEPEVRGLRFDGADTARAASGVTQALADPALAAILITPSNPYLSIDPILAIRDIREGLKAATAPVIAVSPIVAGAALKGPTAKIMREMGKEPSVGSIAEHYRGIIDGLVIDDADAALTDSVRSTGMEVVCTNTVMQTLKTKTELARFILRFAQTIDQRKK